MKGKGYFTINMTILTVLCIVNILGNIFLNRCIILGFPFITSNKYYVKFFCCMIVYIICILVYRY